MLAVKIKEKFMTKSIIFSLSKWLEYLPWYETERELVDFSASILKRPDKFTFSLEIPFHIFFPFNCFFFFFSILYFDGYEAYLFGKIVMKTLRASLLVE